MIQRFTIGSNGMVFIKRYEQPKMNGAQSHAYVYPPPNEKYSILYWTPRLGGDDHEETWEELFEMVDMVEGKSDTWVSSGVSK